MNRTTTTLKRLDEDSYAILNAGVFIGEVTKAWSRLGGKGWTYTNKRSGDARIDTVLTLPTRAFAVQLLLRRIANGETNTVRSQRRLDAQRKTTK